MTDPCAPSAPSCPADLVAAADNLVSWIDVVLADNDRVMRDLKGTDR